MWLAKAEWQCLCFWLGRAAGETFRAFMNVGFVTLCTAVKAHMLVPGSSAPHLWQPDERLRRWNYVEDGQRFFAFRDRRSRNSGHSCKSKKLDSLEVSCRRLASCPSGFINSWTRVEPSSRNLKRVQFLGLN